MNFVHLQVWRNFENSLVNKAAEEWIYRDRSKAIFEPWVFVLGGDGAVASVSTTW